MANVVIPDLIRIAVMQRARNCCEYCISQDRFSPVYFTIDHIIPDGNNDIENLAYACMLCNRLKWKNISAFDPITNTPALLYNPRLDTWSDHFQWSADFQYIIGISSSGRSTVLTLQLNREKLISYRKGMIEIGFHPPSERSN